MITTKNFMQPAEENGPPPSAPKPTTAIAAMEKRLAAKVTRPDVVRVVRADLAHWIFALSDKLHEIKAKFREGSEPHKLVSEALALIEKNL